MNIYTNKFNAQQKVLVRQFFEDKNAVFSELQYADWKATVSGISAALYTSGKFVLQGKDVSSLAEELESKLGISTIDTNSVKQQTLLSVPKKRPLLFLNISELTSREKVIFSDLWLLRESMWILNLRKSLRH